MMVGEKVVMSNQASQGSGTYLIILIIDLFCQVAREVNLYLLGTGIDFNISRQEQIWLLGFKIQEQINHDTGSTSVKVC